jgi:hypothetical protein
MNLKALGIALVALTLVACASQPMQPAANVAAPATTPPAAALAPSKSGAEAVPVAVSADGKAPAVNRTFIQAGYKATSIKGEVFYCRQEDVIGTNFKKKVCLNEDQMKAQEERMKNMEEQMLKNQANPGCFSSPCS